MLRFFATPALLALLLAAGCDTGGTELSPKTDETDQQDGGSEDTGAPDDPGGGMVDEGGTEPDEGGPSPDVPEEATCKPGTPLCDCLDGSKCPGAAGLVCEEGLCIFPGCDIGSFECHCDVNDNCDAGLECRDGQCLEPIIAPCVKGNEGCECAAGNECFPPLVCVGDLCVVDQCPDGQEGCACGDGCDDGLVCMHDMCAVPPPCDPGDEGCACNAGVCGLSARGEQLECADDVCAAPSCTPGTTGCVCEAAWICADESATCNDGYCMELASCVDGAFGCPCTNPVGGDGSCASGLTCRDGAICVDGSGLPGGPCRPDGSCDRGSSCNGGLCQLCTLGTRGCDCTDLGACYGKNSCYSGVCVDSASVPAEMPAVKTCYSNCSGSFTDALGVWRVCSADKLIEGCKGDRECREGSCLLPEDPVPTCERDLDCMEWQACMGGECLSNCSSDSNCNSGYECYRRVCRRPCETIDDCDAGYGCDLLDGSAGYCVPSEPSDPSVPAQLQVFGGIAVEPTSLDLTDRESSVIFALTNDSPTTSTIRVRRAEHYIVSSDGPPETLIDPDDDTICDPLVDCPLWWIELGEDGTVPASVPELAVELAAGETKDIRVQIAGDGVDAVRWSGRLDVISDHGTTSVNLTWTSQPDGTWRGRAFYYASFEDENLGEWVASGNICSGVDPISGKDASTLQTQIRNAFVQKWTAFRCGRDDWDEMRAVMQATETGSWRDTSKLPECDRDACYLYDGEADGVGDYADVLTSTPVPQGATQLPVALNLYTPSPSSDPTVLAGRIDSPVALHYAGDPAVNLELSVDPSTCDRVDKKGNCLVFVTDFGATIQVGGRYVTSEDDTACAARAGDGYALQAVPWLLPGFSRATSYDGDTGLLYRYECRDEALPFDPAQAPEPDPIEALNRTLAGSNPVPDGRSRMREIELIDGVLLNGSSLVILFAETMPSFMDPSDAEGIRTYGYMVLEKVSDEVDEEDDDNDGVPNAYEGNAIDDQRGDPASELLAVQCEGYLLDAVLEPGEELDATTAPRVINALISGVADTVPPAALTPDDDEQVHYFCEDTGLIDGGPGNSTPHGIPLAGQNNSCTKAGDGLCQDGGPLATSSQCALGTDLTDCGPRQTDDADPREPCPSGSKVEFFTVSKNLMPQGDIANLACQQSGSCLEQLNQWKSSADPLMNVKPVFRCESGGAYCDLNRIDLRDGKEFMAATDPVAVFPPFRAEMEGAFRYRVRFRSRNGSSSVGFAPEICIPDSDQIPYCYDPPEIEALAERVDCLLHVWDTLHVPLQQAAAAGGVAGAAADDALEALDDFLAFNYSVETAFIGGDPNRPLTFDGFERLYSELLIMMGDESYTQAFASRFDLAGQQLRSFEGELFEEGGINLSGVAGFEMVSLYQAAQYYQEVLDRFYAMSPLIWLSVKEDQAEQNDPAGYHRTSFVTPAMVTTYMERVLRASTQKSRAWSQIATRYQSLNQPELARRVIERAYTATYLESMALSRVVQKIHDVFQEADRPQIEKVLTDGSRRFRMGLLEMRKVYDSISDETTIFGLDPDIIPFPTLNSVNKSEDNAFQKLVGRAWQRVQIASSREDQAIASDRSYETDSAQFQSELTRIRNTYESQLGDLCGTFEVDEDGDGLGDRIYPAIRKYASLNPYVAPLGDPCGYVGNGGIHEAMAAMDGLSIDMQQHLTRYSNLFAQIDNEVARVDAQCELIDGLASYALCVELGEQCNNVPDDNSPVSKTNNVFVLDSLVNASRLEAQAAQMIYDDHINTMILAKCETPDLDGPGNCPLQLIAASESKLMSALNTTVQIGTQANIGLMEWTINELRVRQGVFQTQSQCDQIRIDSEARTKDMLLQLSELDLEVQRTQHQMRLAYSNIDRLRNTAKRLQLEQEETEQMTINVEAARNDPNVRIYKNDAIINADFAFEDALKQVYRATRVFEYYTSQTYAEREQLYLIRMVKYGDYNLENYLIELENRFQEFEETYGDPDLRVQVLSLKNDLLNIPYEDATGKPLTGSERNALLRETLRDPSLLDPNGYLTIPFRTDTGELSPLTRNHKIAWMEVDFQASEWGDDDVGRVYLRQKGTGTVHALDGSDLFYRFPERTAVVDVFFMGTRSPLIDPEVYKSWRFRDRPYANTNWELVINQRDEPANMDIDLQSVTDIKIYVYYTDFTAL